ncbi:hypothetical protein ACWCRD_40355 [Streptomyces sp. NPDC002092]
MGQISICAAIAGVPRSRKEGDTSGEAAARAGAGDDDPGGVDAQFSWQFSSGGRRVPGRSERWMLHREQAGNYADAAAYGTPWARARKYVVTRTELASKLAKRPYDLRHAGECARRAGQSIEVLFRHYAKFLDGVREQANRLIEQSLQEWDRVSQGAKSEG